jgi:carbon storage regulator
MLILTRREGDAIYIDGGVRIVVLSVDRKGVRLGIEAPSDVRILRGEIVAEVENATKGAATGESARSMLDKLPRPAPRPKES